MRALSASATREPRTPPAPHTSGGRTPRLRAALGRVPRGAWACSLVALASALAWSLLVPPFEVPDENAHYAYVQQVAERGTLPRHVLPEGMLSPAEDATLGAVGFYEIVGEKQNPAPMSELQQRRIDAVGSAGLPTKGSGDALSATNNPPLYYALAAIPYKIGASGSVLDRLALMRVLSALLGAVTVLAVYLFLSELLPGNPLARTAGTLAVALQPLFGFMSGGVNNDALLYPMAAIFLWGIARAFRRSLTPATGALIGGALGLGIISKLTLLGFVPAAGLALALLLRRSWTAERARALRGAAWAVALAAAPVLLYVVLNRLVWDRGAVPGGLGSVPSAPGVVAHFNFKEELSHIWQLYLPPLGMRHQYSYLPLWNTWFQGFIGRFGWLDYGFPRRFYKGALVIVLAIVALAIGELVRRRRVLPARLGELAVYVTALLGICIEVGIQSYRQMIDTGGTMRFEQARYMLPLLCLYGAIVALAVRFGGRRWGPPLAAALVVLALFHDLLAQAITVSRYYA